MCMAKEGLKQSQSFLVSANITNMIYVQLNKAISVLLDRVYVNCKVRSSPNLHMI
jgi:hypothetical protein